MFPLSRLNALRVANDRLRRECVRAHTDKGLRGEFKMALPIVKVDFLQLEIPKNPNSYLQGDTSGFFLGLLDIITKVEF